MQDLRSLNNIGIFNGFSQECANITWSISKFGGFLLVWEDFYFFFQKTNNGKVLCCDICGKILIIAGYGCNHTLNLCFFQYLRLSFGKCYFDQYLLTMDIWRLGANIVVHVYFQCYQVPRYGQIGYSYLPKKVIRYMDISMHIQQLAQKGP